MKRTLSLILALMLLFSLAACGGGENGGNGSGPVISVVHPDFQLSGSFIEPVERQDTAPEGYIPISTAEEFAKIGLNPAANYILMADIDLAGMEWSLISDFNGILEGNGHTVSNASDTLFGTIQGGTVQNLAVHANLVGKGAGIAYVVTGGGRLFNCSFTGSLMGSDSNIAEGFQGYTTVAGLVFKADGASIISCYNGADLTAGNICSGIVSEIREAVTVLNCLNTGSVTVEVQSNVCGDGIAGGIVAQMHIGSSDGGASNITNCRNSAPVSGNLSAGILGEAYIAEPVNLYIRQCCNEGNIYSEASYYRLSRSSAGILNVMIIEEGYITVSDCYNTGDYVHAGIEGGESLQRAWDARSADLDHVRIERCFNTAWAFAGSISVYAKNLDYCYFLDAQENIDETATGDGALFATVRQLTGDEMAKESSFEGFDFETVWQMGEDHPVFARRDY